MLVEIVVTQRSEVFFIERYREIAEVGYYSLAFTIYSLFLGVGLTLIHGFYPAISTDIGSNSREKVQTKVNKGVIVSVIYAIPIIFGCIVIIDPIIRMLYGEKMIMTVPIIQLLILGLFPGMIVGISGLLLSAIGGIWDRVIAGIISVLVNIILSILLIPNHGVLGAALSNVISQLVNASLLYLIIMKKYKINYPWIQILVIAIIGLLVTGAFPYTLMILLPSTIGSIISIALAIIVFYMSLKKLKIWNYLSEE
jgi:O-antigen/teichoic acid export membrane protein